MREIKFRAKGLNNNKWYYGYFVKDSESSDILNNEDNNFYYVDENTVGQYTGLKDKKGVEIYEGDILAVKKSKRGIAKGIMKYGEFNCSCCLGVYGWYIDTDDDYYLDIRDFNTNTMSNSEIEVIGNIYENKELLEGE